MPKTLSTKQAAGVCKGFFFFFCCFCTSLWQTLKQNLAWYSQMRIYSCQISFKSENKIEGAIELEEKLFYSLATENGDSPQGLYFNYGSIQNNSNPDNSKWQLNFNKSQNFFSNQLSLMHLVCLSCLLSAEDLLCLASTSLHLRKPSLLNALKCGADFTALFHSARGSHEKLMK